MDLAPRVEEAIAAMRAGAVQSADDILSHALATLHEEQIAAGEREAPAPPPPSEQLIEILDYICERLGAPTELEVRIRLLEKSAPPEVAPKDSPASY